MSQPKFSQRAQTGFAAAAAYDKHRPSYPPQVVEQFLSRLEISGVDRAKVIDLAAGTGKFTELLAARPEQFEITAIEPHGDMLEQLRKKNIKNVIVQAGSAEDLSQVPSQSVAAVSAAQAFHWFANMTALKEIHRVLQPKGVLGMIWNVEDYNAPRSWNIHAGWETTLHNLVWEQDDDQPRFRHEKWKAVFDEQNSGFMLLKDPMFGMPIGEESVSQTIYLSKQDVWSRFRTLSQIAILEGEELKKTEKIFWEAIDASETETNSEGLVAVHVTTVFAWASKIPDVPLKSDQAM